MNTTSPSDSLVFLPDGYVDSPTSFLSSDSSISIWEGRQTAPVSANHSVTSSVSLSSLEGFRFGSQSSSSSCSSSLLEHRSTVSSSSETSSEGTSSSSFPSFSLTPPYPTSSSAVNNRGTYPSSISRSPSRSSKPLLHLPLSNQTAPVPPSLIARRGSLPATNAVPFHLPPPTFTANRGVSNGHQGPPPAPSSWSGSARFELQGIPSPLRMEHSSDELARGGEEDDDDVAMEDAEFGRRSDGRSPSRINGSPSPANGNRSNGGNHSGMGRGKAPGPSSSPYGRGGSSRKMSLPTHFSSHTTTTSSSSSSSSSSSTSSSNIYSAQPAVSSTALMSRSTFTLGVPPHGGKQPLSPESPTTQLHSLPPHLQVQYQHHQQQQQIKQPTFPPTSFLHQQAKPNNSGYPFPPQQKPQTPPATPRTTLSGLPPPYQKSVSSQESTPGATPSPPPPPPAPPVPTTLSATLLDGHDLNPLFESRYALTSSLGSGGYGFVCVATELATRREVAVKFILASKIPPHAWVEYGGNGEEGDGMPPAGGKVPMECEVLRRVNHWGVVQGLGVFCDGKFFYLVQELHGDPWGPSTPGTPTASSTASLPPLPLNALGPPSPFAPSFALPASPYVGPSQGPPLPTSPITPIRPSINMERRGSCDLFECVERHKKFGEARARMIFKQIVDTVSYLSRIGIYHRDIKDENLVIDRDYRVKLIDFGSAVWERDPEHPRKYKEFFGTTAYASPEIITGHHYYAAEAEVWSLGILLCILVTGESPFHSPKEAQVGRRSPLRNGLRMSRELNDLIDRCLKVSPERRITIDEMRGHRWLGGGQGQGQQ